MCFLFMFFVWGCKTGVIGQAEAAYSKQNTEEANQINSRISSLNDDLK